VYDWKKLEFDPLQTPTFDIPFEVTAGLSWGQRIRDAFGSLAVPAVSFAAFAIVSVVVASLIWQSSGNVKVVSTTVTPAVIAPVKDEVAPPARQDLASGNVDKVDTPNVSASERPSRAALPKRIARRARILNM
jgi:hypothetical protein